MHSYQSLQQYIEDGIQALDLPQSPSALYDPVRYVLRLGGKRIRPVLTLMATELFDGSLEEARNPAIGLEVFHNFTLVHDDIMDQAALRRGHPTVHCQWNTNNAILSGDLMHVIASDYMSHVGDDILRPVMQLYHTMAKRVCEGQQHDMDFERQDGITVSHYLQMIGLKTANLVATALELGAVIGRASDSSKNDIRDLGFKLGMAFQIQDDLLDTFGDAEHFGKQIGGDIMAGKRTYLYLKAMELADEQTRAQLQHLLQEDQLPPEEKVKLVKDLYENLGVAEATERLRTDYYEAALEALEKIPVSEDRKAGLRHLAEFLMQRTQ
jgi:geranylgeranyl diphosphate synthase type II